MDSKFISQVKLQVCYCGITGAARIFVRVTFYPTINIRVADISAATFYLIYKITKAGLCF